MSFLKSCFKPCIGRDSSVPADVAQKSSVQSTATTPVTGSTEKPASKKMPFAEWLAKYRKGEVTNDYQTEAPTELPEDEKFLRAQLPLDERERQLNMYKYQYQDEPNYHDGKNDQGTEPTPQSETLFRIVNLARNTFGVKVALLSLLDDECQYFKSEVGLAEAGMTGMETVPRDISFCGHTILSKAPMVILDCSKDWRMKNNPLVANPPHVRFYAGVPIIAPEGYALGTLCIIDLEPRASFDGGPKLVEFAELAMAEIKSLYERNQQEKMIRMRSAIDGFPTPAGAPSSASAHVMSALEFEESRLRMKQTFTHEQQQAVFKAGRNQGLKVVAKTGSLKPGSPTTAESSTAVSDTTAGAVANSSLEQSIANDPSSLAAMNALTHGQEAGEKSMPAGLGNQAPAQPLAANSEGLIQTQHKDGEAALGKPIDEHGTAGTTTVDESIVATPAKNPYDLSVLLIAQTLNLDLVYLLALESSAETGTTTRVVSSYGLASDPVFDAGLHGRALRSKSGLLYVHPDPESAVARELGTYISGMLVPVLQLGNGGGYVLAAFTKKKSQVFVAEDLKFLRDFGISLMRWLLQSDAMAAQQQVEQESHAVQQ
ncbi:hypothetical protein BCR37DRAFT_378491 [Protomyces lactucae-debilis]|uniref:GAF domain-containing protein n=1 Tax=Protomyces lactucae-debilis TaxID=2754530 RepID=A0A1Y2FKH7_PROLT|nr:uncharacterized protein BCR37DRAFT_378491 [Protomyces lactucae-debilis]ORY84458.1 hypothetical protein BCR37DRAFT_378491 [Protomyces lactucae-debilis]